MLIAKGRQRISARKKFVVSVHNTHESVKAFIERDYELEGRLQLTVGSLSSQKPTRSYSWT